MLRRADHEEIHSLAQADNDMRQTFMYGCFVHVMHLEEDDEWETKGGTIRASQQSCASGTASADAGCPPLLLTRRSS